MKLLLNMGIKVESEMVDTGVVVAQRHILACLTKLLSFSVPQQWERGERSIFLFLVFCYFRVQETKIAKGTIFEDTYKKE